MTRHLNIGSCRLVRTLLTLCLIVSGLTFAAAPSGAAEQAIGPPPSGTRQTLVPPPIGIQAFHPGETLTYDVSWSGAFSAGTVTMTVATERLPEGRQVLKFVVQGRTQGLADKIYPVDDAVQSVFDPQIMQSLSYQLRESFGKKKRLRTIEFDHTQRKAVCRLNEDPPETLDTPDPVLDGLSLIYILRTKEGLETGRRMDIDVVDSGKNWTIEVTVLDREKVATPAGEFDAIKIRTQPRFKGELLNKGICFLWLTDDGWKIPVMMKNKLSVGSFVFELKDMKPGTHRIAQ